MHIKVKRGLDIPLAGEPEQSIWPAAAVSQVAVCGVDFPGLKPRVLVNEGDRVGPLDALFIDKRDPAVQYCAPGKGTVVSINRGARRLLQSVVIDLEDTEGEEPVYDLNHDGKQSPVRREDIVQRLLQTGLWTAFRTRPFSQVPHSESVPQALFVSALDTRPLAADPMVTIRLEPEAFIAGLNILPGLTTGAVNLCVAEDWNIELPPIDRLRTVRFSGPHPAGLPGTHIHFLHPVGRDKVVWHISYQDVIAIGKLFKKGVLDYRRIVALSGYALNHPRLVLTRSGASLDQLLNEEIKDPDACRVISGSVLGGRAASRGLAFLGRYHDQVSVIEEGGPRRFMGWTDVLPHRYSDSRTFKRSTGLRRKFTIPTLQNGRFNGMIPVRAFEKVMPLDILPSPLFRALLVTDTDQAQALGCLELDEEDVALCSFVCPAKIDYSLFLRTNLERIQREG